MMPIRHIRLGATAAIVALATIGSAHAAGCMKGAVGGCIVGHHMAKKQAQEQAAQHRAAAQGMQPAQ
ncbi:hypothetical protein [Burkholderia sp. HI2500]|uniref:hypothetical protein n=1 Tax=Burkholderia sp. HI2500 TaxID=2015358 RepID=UPI000B7A20EB|nr:hypothetical protein [Burkholderia sp. HI2500]OXJ18672.1 hypothetical protein CFB45_00135 [Burkholderia sp. HI2500]